MVAYSVNMPNKVVCIDARMRIHIFTRYLHYG